jgi:hypothetical protein
MPRRRRRAFQENILNLRIAYMEIHESVVKTKSLATFLLSAACDTLFQPGEFHCVQEN